MVIVIIHHILKVRKKPKMINMAKKKIKKQLKQLKQSIDISRSFSRKVNLGNYQTEDYFCSAHLEVDKKDAEEASLWLDDFVQGEVMKSVEAKLNLRDKAEEANRELNEIAHDRIRKQNESKVVGDKGKSRDDRKADAELDTIQEMP